MGSIEAAAGVRETEPLAQRTFALTAITMHKWIELVSSSKLPSLKNNNGSDFVLKTWFNKVPLNLTLKSIFQ